jgi:hypothetical protein
MALTPTLLETVTANFVIALLCEILNIMLVACWCRRRGGDSLAVEPRA